MNLTLLIILGIVEAGLVAILVMHNLRDKEI